MEAKEYLKAKELEITGRFFVPAMYFCMDDDYEDKLLKRRDEIKKFEKSWSKKKKTGFYITSAILIAALFLVAIGIELLAGQGFRYVIFTAAAAIAFGTGLGAGINTIRTTSMMKHGKKMFDSYYKDRVAFKANMYLYELLRDPEVTFMNVVMGGGKLTMNYMKNGKIHVDDFTYESWPDDPDLESPFVRIENNRLFGRGSTETARASFTTSMIGED